ncbi:hypothetical protein PFLuk1_03254 [Pseudomonas fluorescens]|nr:hypothetical protein PFLuk1_03254 [Pseudomonas fluorescens]
MQTSLSHSKLNQLNPVRLTTEAMYADLENIVGELFIHADAATYDHLRYKFKTEYLTPFIAELKYAKSLAISRAIQRRKTDNTYSE